jgi:hypothetical protein
MHDLGDELATALEIGDNLAVNTKEGNDGVYFSLILCTEPLRKVTKAFTDGWGTSFEEGDDVVRGIYYQKWGHNDTSYVLLKDSQKVYIFSHMVRVIKFLMPPMNH